VTKKDFEAIAGAIKDARMALPSSPTPHDAKTQAQVIVSMARSIAYVLAKQNARFDRSRFLAACGVDRP
jgi:hypothetical protein